MLEALFALRRKAVENEPLKIFMALSDLDRNRAEAAGAGHRGLAGAQLPHLRQPVRHLQRIAAALSDKSIAAVPGYRRAGYRRLKDPLLRADALGTLQALVGLWQILVPLGQSCRPAKADEAFAALLGAVRRRARRPRAVRRRPGRASALLHRRAPDRKRDSPRQGRMLDLLAGAADSSDVESRTQMVAGDDAHPGSAADRARSTTSSTLAESSGQRWRTARS